MNNPASEIASIEDAYESQLRIMYGVMLDAIVLNDESVDAICSRFKRGVELARKAKALAIQLLAE